MHFLLTIYSCTQLLLLKYNVSCTINSEFIFNIVKIIVYISYTTCRPIFRESMNKRRGVANE